MLTLSRITSQDSPMNQAHAPTRGAETKQPTPKTDKANDTEWPNRPRAGERKEAVTYQKKQTRPQSQQHRLYTQEGEKERSQQSFDFKQIVCQRSSSKKIDKVEVRGDLFDSTDSKTHSFSSDFKLAEGNAKQVRKEFPTTYPELGRKSQKRNFMQNNFLRTDSVIISKSSQGFGRNRLTVPCVQYWKPCCNTRRNKKNEKIGVLKLSTGFDNLSWLKMKGIIGYDFHDWSIKVKVYTQPEKQNASPSRTQKRNKDADATSARGRSQP